MGAVVSRWRAKPSTVDILEGIDKDIHTLEEFREKNQRLLKLWVGRLLLYSSLLFLISAFVVYFWYLPRLWTKQLVLAVLFLAYPILVWFTRKFMISVFSKRTERNDEKLEDLKSKKRKILEEVMETETYKNAKMILERFDPDSKKKVLELESSTVGPQMTPRPGQELRQRNVASRPPLAGTLVSPVAHPPLAPGSTPLGPLLHSAPGGPPERSLAAAAAQQGLMRSPMSLGMALNPPGPPLARPILPRDRGAMDRVIEYLVGDGPQNRYALICQQCFSHNGMALKEEFEYVAFRCAYCYFLNPARKTRPQAPRLPEFSLEQRTHLDTPAAGLSAGPKQSDAPCDPGNEMLADSPPVSELESQESSVTEEVQDAEGPGAPESEKIPSENTEEELDVSQMEVE